MRLSEPVSKKKVPKVSILDDEAKIVTLRLGKNRFRVAGTAEISDCNLDILDVRITTLKKWVEQNCPEVLTKDAQPRAGLKPKRPNMMPLVSQSKKANIFYNTGHGHLAWTLACYTANMVGELMNAYTHK